MVEVVENVLSLRHADGLAGPSGCEIVAKFILPGKSYDKELQAAYRGLQSTDCVALALYVASRGPIPVDFAQLAHENTVGRSPIAQARPPPLHMYMYMRMYLPLGSQSHCSAEMGAGQDALPPSNSLAVQVIPKPRELGSFRRRERKTKKKKNLAVILLGP